MIFDALIEAPFNLGLKEPLSGVEPGVRFLPDALKALNFDKKLGINTVIRIDAPAYISVIEPASGIRNAGEVAAYSKKLLTSIYHMSATGKRPLVIGGDCSILIGVMAGLKKKGRYGLYFMDGHTDFVTLNQSGTKAAAGMDLAIVAGIGHPLLTDIEELKPYVNEAHIYCFGNREYNHAYESTVTNSKVSYYPLFKIRQDNIGHITRSFLLMLAEEKMEGFWLHLDADVLNDELMPCVDSRTPGGLSYEELSNTIIPLISSPLFSGMSVTIVDPTMDTGNTIVSEFADKLIEILTHTTSSMTSLSH